MAGSDQVAAELAAHLVAATRVEDDRDSGSESDHTDRVKAENVNPGRSNPAVSPGVAIPPPGGAGNQLASGTVVPQAARMKPDRMEQSFFDQLVRDELPIPLIRFMSRENVNRLSDLANYCPSKESVHSLLVDACPDTKGERRHMVPLARLWDVAVETGKLEVRRQVEGVTDQALETPLNQEEVDSLNNRYRRSYGYSLTPFELLWPHLWGRLRREIDQKAWTAIELTRVGSEVEAGRSPATRQWRSGPGMTTVANATAGRVRQVKDNHAMIELCYRDLGYAGW